MLSYRRAMVGFLAFLTGVLLSIAACSPAYAWEVAKSSNGVVVMRQSDDSTATVGLSIYHGYKGGDSWSASYPVFYAASYAAATTYVNFIVDSADVVEVPLDPANGRVQMVYLNDGKRLAVLCEPMNVAVQGTVPVSVATTLPVSLDTTLGVSIGTTLPVEVVGIGAVERAELTVVLIIGGLCLGIATFGAVVSVWGGRS